MQLISIVSGLVLLSPALAEFNVSPQPSPTPTLAISTLSTAGTHYSPTLPAPFTLSPAQSTAIFSALASVETTWRGVYSYKLLESEVFIAAPTDAQLSLAVNGYNWDDIVKQSWYQTGVSTQWKNMVDVQEIAMQSALNQAVGVKSGGERLDGVAVMALFVGMGVLDMAFLV